MTAFRQMSRRASPRLIGGLLVWGLMETAALRRARRQRQTEALKAQLRA